MRLRVFYKDSARTFCLTRIILVFLTVPHVNLNASQSIKSRLCLRIHFATPASLLWLWDLSHTVQQCAFFQQHFTASPVKVPGLRAHFRLQTASRLATMARSCDERNARVNHRTAHAGSAGSGHPGDHSEIPGWILVDHSDWQDLEAAVVLTNAQTLPATTPGEGRGVSQPTKDLSHHNQSSQERGKDRGADFPGG